jgi:hypothetical protein
MSAATDVFHATDTAFATDVPQSPTPVLDGVVVTSAPCAAQSSWGLLPKRLAKIRSFLRRATPTS